MRSLSTMLASVLVACAALAGCGEDGFTEPRILGGQVVQPETLNLGRERYVQYCRQCHGDQGAGDGPAAPGLRPPPRNFQQGLFKFAAVPAGELPHDADLVRIVAGGLHGTAMLPWQVPESDLGAIIQYIKTLSPRWQTGRPGPRILPTPDPWRGRREEAERRGFNVYHGLAECWSCHAAYGTRQEIFDAYREMRGAGSSDFRDDMYNPVLKDSQYGVNILPPEFLRDPVRSVRNRPAQCWSCHGDRGYEWIGRNLDHHELEDFYRIIASGIGGTAMPAWRDSLPEDQIWAMAYYVRSLAHMRDAPAGTRLRDRLTRQPAFVPPAAPAPAPAPAEGAAAPSGDSGDAGPGFGVSAEGADRTHPPGWTDTSDGGVPQGDGGPGFGVSAEGTDRTRPPGWNDPGAGDGGPRAAPTEGSGADPAPEAPATP